MRKAGWRVDALIGQRQQEAPGSSQTEGTRGTETKQCGARLDEMQRKCWARTGGRLAGDGMEAGASQRAAAGCGAARSNSSPANGQPSKQ